MKKIKVFLKKYFITGLLVIIPVWATFYVLRAILGWIDGMLGPLLGEYLGLKFPGLGIVTLVFLVLSVGVLSANYLGRRLVKYSDAFLQKVPLVRGVYSTIKQIMQTFSVEHNFHGVAAVEYPRKGCWSVGFMTGQVRGEYMGTTGRFVTVFVPTTPNPTAGFLLILPEAEVKKLDLTVEEGMKFIISVGLVPMDEVQTRKLNHRGQEAL